MRAPPPASLPPEAAARPSSSSTSPCRSRRPPATASEARGNVPHDLLRDHPPPVEPEQPESVPVPPPGDKAPCALRTTRLHLLHPLQRLLRLLGLEERAHGVLDRLDARGRRRRPVRLHALPALERRNRHPRVVRGPRRPLVGARVLSERLGPQDVGPVVHDVGLEVAMGGHGRGGEDVGDAVVVRQHVANLDAVLLERVEEQRHGEARRERHLLLALFEARRADAEALQHDVHDPRRAEHRHRLRRALVPRALGAVVLVVAVQRLLLYEEVQQVNQLVRPLHVHRDVEARLQLLRLVVALGAYQDVQQVPPEYPPDDAAHDVFLRQHPRRVVGVLGAVAALDERLEEVLQENERVLLPPQLVLPPYQLLHQVGEGVLRRRARVERALHVRLKDARDADDFALRVPAHSGVRRPDQCWCQVGRVRDHLQHHVHEADVDSRVVKPPRHLVELLVPLGERQHVHAEGVASLQRPDEGHCPVECRSAFVHHVDGAWRALQLPVLEIFHLLLRGHIFLRLDEADVPIVQLYGEVRQLLAQQRQLRLVPELHGPRGIAIYQTHTASPAPFGSRNSETCRRLLLTLLRPETVRRFPSLSYTYELLSYDARPEITITLVPNVSHRFYADSCSLEDIQRAIDPDQYRGTLFCIAAKVT
ncbi:2-octaprenyl-3-methyl-6-methoxy-1,4-benzoquinol hydroxylase, putative [Babesia caballi]|uniref:2-octaprenyl-3-methyl-6-methoxy-1,4-benzoquinol hydroxylase, putative n=1 Tax=Babesia caballi TaxID=5871 RepID=A0AAV4LMP1_BABCB|nr:2-octaprenyl-3-methyl-6-methoxy-1,4-benzoquinol hydroxylase, putative [Babesia caballi]